MAINIKVDRDRMSAVLTVDEYLALLEGDVKTMVEILSKFVVDDNGVFLDKKEGRKIIGGLTLDEMKTAIEAFTNNVQDAAVSPTNGAG